MTERSEIPGERGRVVRVFVCSTFRDFAEERDLIAKRVFPQLRRRARERFVEVVGVDLRWGITEEESDRGETLPICLREVDRSRPYFVGLVGERYGWTPSPDLYSPALLARQPWLADHAGGSSVTELEILHGVLNNPAVAGRARFYFRDPAWSAARGPDCRSEDAAERAKLARLKERIRASGVPVRDCADPESIAAAIADDLWQAIDAEYPAESVPDELERDRRQHEAYAAERRRIYVGQRETLEAILRHLRQASDHATEESARTRALLVTGDSGAGKSSLLANAAWAWRQSSPADAVIEHYVGSGHRSAHMDDLLQRLADELSRLVGATNMDRIDEGRPEERFERALSQASSWARGRNARVVLMVDALDRLGDDATLAWLPRMIPTNVRVVLSMLDCQPLDAARGRGWAEVAVPPLKPDVARDYVVETLARHGRRLPDAELSRIIDHPKSCLPIFLKSLVDELSVFGSFEGLSGRITQCLSAADPGELFQVILARLESDLGRDAVRRPLEAIWASYDGMAEDELVDFCGVKPIELARLRLSLDEALHESRSLLRFGHVHVRDAVGARYLVSAEAQREIHRALAAWWQRQEQTERAVRESCDQLFRAEDWGGLLRYLSEPETGIPAVACVTPGTLFGYWRAIAAGTGRDSTIELIDRSIRGHWDQWSLQVGTDEFSIVDLHRLERFLVHASVSTPLAREVSDTSIALARRFAKRDALPRQLRNQAKVLVCASELRKHHGDLPGALDAARESVSVIRRIQGNEEAPDTRWDLAWALTAMGIVQQAIGRLDDAADSFGEAFEIRKQLAEQLKTPESRQNFANALTKLAGIDIARGDLDTGLERSSAAASIAREVAEDLATDDALRDLAINLTIVSHILRSRGDLGSALDSAGEAAEIMHALAARSGTAQSLSDANLAMSHIAEIERARGNLDHARSILEERVCLDRRLAEDTGAPSFMRSLRISIGQLARLDSQAGRLADAAPLRREALSIARNMGRAAASTEAMSDLCHELTNSAEVERAGGNLNLAHALASEGVSVARAVLDQLSIPDHLAYLHDALMELGDANVARAARDEARTQFQECIRIADELASTLGTPESSYRTTIARSRLAALAQDVGLLDEAIARFEETLTIMRTACERTGSHEYLQGLGTATYRVAQLKEQTGDLPGARDVAAESLDIARRIDWLLSTPATMLEVAIRLSACANIERAVKNTREAIDFLEDAIESARTVYSRSPSRDSSFALAKFLRIGGDWALEAADTAKAASRFDEAIAIARDALATWTSADARYEFASILARHAGLERRAGRTDSARSSFEEVIALMREVCEKDRIPEHWRGLKIALRQLGGVLQEAGDVPGARACLIEGLQIARHIADSPVGAVALFGVCQVLAELAAVEQASGDLPAAESHLEEAVRAARRAHDAIRETGSLHMLGVMLAEHAAIALEQDMHDRGRVLLEESLGIARSVAAECPSAEALGRVCAIAARLSEVTSAVGDRAAAAGHLDAAIEALDSIAAAEREPDHDRVAIQLLARRADLFNQAGDPVAAAERCDRAIAVLRRLQDPAGDVGDAQAIVSFAMHAARLDAGAGRLEPAIARLDAVADVADLLERSRESGAGELVANYRALRRRIDAG
jgi:tetratricopeptide (TPR) repeat protein